MFDCDSLSCNSSHIGPVGNLKYLFENAKIDFLKNVIFSNNLPRFDDVICEQTVLLQTTEALLKVDGVLALESPMLVNYWDPSDEKQQMK